MFKKLVNSLLGRNRMSSKDKKQIKRWLEIEYRFTKDQVEYLIETGNFKKLNELETYK